MVTFVLVHSPLVGPLTWSLVADELQRKGYGAVAPALPYSDEMTPPYWKGHAGAVAQSIGKLPGGDPIVLAGHSGAGMLLPAIGQASGRPVAAYIFVDAQIPRNGMSRLDFFEPDEARAFRASAADGLLPTWSDSDLVRALPDPDIRRRFVQELRPLQLAVYEEPIPVFEGWPDAPCAYIQFTPIYDQSAEQARQAGWPCRKLYGGHFLMLNDPPRVAGALVDLAGQIM